MFLSLALSACSRANSVMGGNRGRVSPSNTASSPLACRFCSARQAGPGGDATLPKFAAPDRCRSSWRCCAAALEPPRSTRAGSPSRMYRGRPARITDLSGCSSPRPDRQRRQTQRKPDQALERRYPRCPSAPRLRLVTHVTQDSGTVRHARHCRAIVIPRRTLVRW